MSEQTTLLEKLEGLLIRFEEIGTLITDPAVIGDMKRFVKLTKEYRDLEKISEAAKRYKQILNGIEEARRFLHVTIAATRRRNKITVGSCRPRR